MSLIDIHNLTHRFADGTTGLEHIDLAVDPGEFIVVAGPNGSGKTTLYRHLNGLLAPSMGTVYLKGRPVSEDLIGARRLIGMVFQDADTQIVGDTVYDDVAFGPENLKMTRPEIDRRVAAALATVGLSHLEQKQPHLLSGGEKRRLAVAGVLAMDPEVLVFDEPFSNLDYPGVRKLMEHILFLHRTGHTLFVSTHDLEIVAAYADRLIIMNNGRIVEDGRPEALMDKVEEFGIRQPCDIRHSGQVRPWLS
jgi:biotin transport system ATP-binding protein